MECGECTLCCLIMPVPWMNKEPSIWCDECSVGLGCRIWESAEKRCKSFACMYNQVARIPLALRPDNCNAIFERIKGDIFLCTLHPDYTEAYKDDIVVGQIRSFQKQEFPVVVTSFTSTIPKVFSTKKRSAREIWQTVQGQLVR